MRRRLTLVSALASASTVLVALAPSSAPAAPTATVEARQGSTTVAAAEGKRRPLRYVAMGDSFSAASGVQPPDLTAAPQCLRSSLNYPHVITERLRAKGRTVRFRDVTCGAADTTDYFTAQYPDVPPQLDALGKRTRLVTMTIGGNNESVFANAIAQCGSAGATTGGQGSPCKEQYGSQFVDTVRAKTFPALKRSLRAVHHKAPRARVAVLGYPWLLPPKGGCYPVMPVATGDVPYLRNLQRVLNKVVKRAARITGSRFVDFSGVSEGHDACQPIGVRWIEPVIGATHPVPVHPNALGERKMAKRTMGVARVTRLP